MISASLTTTETLEKHKIQFRDALTDKCCSTLLHYQIALVGRARPIPGTFPKVHRLIGSKLIKTML